MKQNKYINVSQFEQPNRYPVTFIIGARGVGKTISSLTEKIKYCIKHHCMFIYLRRYQTEIDTSSFNLQLISKLTGYTITRDYTEDKNGKRSEMLLADQTPVCYLLALSTAAKYKSNDYSQVYEIVYDEFIDPRGRELKNETKLFLNFAMTVFRDFSKYHALFLANATNLYNNYFLDFEIMPKNRITKFSQLGIKIVMYQTSDQLEKEHQYSILGRQVNLIEGENGSSLNNRFDNAYDDFINKLTNKSEYLAGLRLDGHLFGLYRDDGNLVISPRSDPNFKSNFAMRFDDATNTIPVVDPYRVSNLIGNFKQGLLRFTDVKTRTQWLKFMKHPNATAQTI